MDGIALSIIVPVYNVEVYLRRCLDSLCFQLNDNVEVILIDDGSIDSSPQICDEYASRYVNINVIHKKNGGLSSARNAGLDIAIGEKIVFIDSDDCVSNEYINELFKIMNLGTSACFSFTMVDAIGNIVEKNIYPKGFFSSHKDGVLSIIKKDSLSYVWNKVYDRNILNTFPITRFVENSEPTEDIIFNSDFFSKSQTIFISDKPLYIYYRYGDYEKKLSHRFYPDLYKKTKLAVLKRKSLLEKIGCSDKYYISSFDETNLYSIYKCVPNMYRKNKIMKRSKRIAFYKEILRSEDIKKWINDTRSSENVLKIFKFLYRLRSSMVMDFVYYILFWIRYNIVLRLK